jgi:hypothetical protein
MTLRRKKAIYNSKKMQLRWGGRLVAATAFYDSGGRQIIPLYHLNACALHDDHFVVPRSSHSEDDDARQRRAALVHKRVDAGMMRTVGVHIRTDIDPIGGLGQRTSF